MGVAAARRFGESPEPEMGLWDQRDRWVKGDESHAFRCAPRALAPGSCY